jgi:alginate O-acetyltransferase complex protein AlgI
LSTARTGAVVFSSPLFLFLFLPLVLCAYYAARSRGRNVVLLVASLLFYAAGELRYVPLVLASVAFNGWIGVRVADGREGARRRWLAFGVAVNLAVLGVFKYAHFAFENWHAIEPWLGLAPSAVAVATIPLPLGISFFTFHAISYIVDVYKRNAAPERRLSVFALYILLFPQLIAGPIIRWRDIAAQLAGREERMADVAYGVRRFVTGLAKKVLIANTLGRVADRVFSLPPGELTTPLAWLGLACYTLQIYFDFSGYSDMAIGLMRMFGMRILENFNYPYVSASVREFWRRWHISLSNWFRDYLYVPLGGNRRGRLREYRNLIVVFLLCGLWHGASWPFVLWGAWHGAFLVLERAGFGRVLERVPVLAHAYALAAVALAWVLFRCDTLSHAGAYYAALAGHAAGDPALHPLGQWLDPLTVTALVAGVAFAMPIGPALARLRVRLADSGGGMGALVLSADVAGLGLLLLASASFLAAGTYNPFIYFRF